MDDKFFAILELGIVLALIMLVVTFKGRKKIKGKQEYYSDFMWHFNKVQALHQKLCTRAQFYIENEYVFDVRPALQQYTKNVSNCLWQASRFANHMMQYNEQEIFTGLLKQAYIQLDHLGQEQKSFSQLLNYCEQEEQKYKNAFAKYGPKADMQDSDDIASGLFNGCTDYGSLHKRYKDLMKVYHSDIQNGDNEMTAKINAEYKRLKEKYNK